MRVHNHADAITPAHVLGRKIRTLRREAGLSLRELGAAAGVSLVQFQRYETGVSQLSAARLLVISSILGVSASCLLGEVDLAQPDDQTNRRRQEDHELAVLFARLTEPADRRAILNLARVSAARDEVQRLTSSSPAAVFPLSQPEPE
jgi:transcriptional regulator with XRE-family HTH domain